MKASGITIKPPPGSLPIDAKALSISASSPAGPRSVRLRTTGQSFSNGPRKNVPSPGAVFGLNRTATRTIPGAISFSIWSHLPTMDGSKW
jgi:hypothetical protein